MASRIETIAIHAARNTDQKVGAVVPPMHLSTTYQRGNDGDFEYSRTGGPTRLALEEVLRQLEGGAGAVAFASGMAAVSSIFQSLQQGDHVILPDDTYFGVRKLVTKLLARWGLAHTIVDMTDLENVKAAIQPNTKMVWAESPSNPMLKIADIAAVADIAHNAGAKLGVDATWSTPILQHSLALGADYVVHSTTKYLGGHNDLLGGVVIVREKNDFYESIREMQVTCGSVPSGFDAWLLLRGIRTLPYRMRAHCANAMKVAQFLEDHPQVHTVHYPGLESHAGHEIAKRQMEDFGGMLSVQVRGGAEKAATVARSTEVFLRATSLGGVESLIDHRAPVEEPDTKTPDDLLRLSVGLEHPDDLIEDLAQALA